MKLRQFYPFFIIFVTSFTGFVLFENLHGFFSKAEILPIRQVRVLGLKNFSAGELIKRLGIQSGDSLLWIRENVLKEKLATTPRIELVSVERSLPETLVLSVVEKESVYLVISGDQRYELDKSGVLIASNEEILNADLLAIEFPTGTSLEKVQQNTVFSNLLKTFSSLPQEEKDFVNILSEVVIGNEITLFPKSMKVSLLLGVEANLEKLRKARYALVYAEQKKISPKRIDLRFDPVKYVM